MNLCVGERASGATDPLEPETFKTPSDETRPTFAIPHEAGRGSHADGFDQTLRLASTGVDMSGCDLLIGSVQFAHHQSVLTPAARTALNCFISCFIPASIAPMLRAQRPTSRTVQKACGEPWPPGDWNVPGPDDGTRSA